MVRSEKVPYAFTTMSVGDVSAMLKSIGLGDHCAAFEKKVVDGVLLAMLDEPSLAELGVESHLDRKKILAWVYKRNNDTVVGVVVANEPVAMVENVL